MVCLGIKILPGDGDIAAQFTSLITLAVNQLCSSQPAVLGQNLYVPLSRFNDCHFFLQLEASHLCIGQLSMDDDFNLILLFAVTCFCCPGGALTCSCQDQLRR